MVEPPGEFVDAMGRQQPNIGRAIKMQVVPGLIARALPSTSTLNRSPPRWLLMISSERTSNRPRRLAPAIGSALISVTRCQTAWSYCIQRMEIRSSSREIRGVREPKLGSILGNGRDETHHVSLPWGGSASMEIPPNGG